MGPRDTAIERDENHHEATLVVDGSTGTYQCPKALEQTLTAGESSALDIRVVEGFQTVENSDDEEELPEWTGGQPRAPLISPVTGPRSPLIIKSAKQKEDERKIREEEERMREAEEKQKKKDGDEQRK